MIIFLDNVDIFLDYVDIFLDNYEYISRLWWATS